MNAVTPSKGLTGLEQARRVFSPAHPRRRAGIGKTMGFDVDGVLCVAATSTLLVFDR